MLKKIIVLTGAGVLAACVTAAYSKPMEKLEAAPGYVLEFISEMHEVKVGPSTTARLFIGYSFGEPDQFSYLQLMNDAHKPGEDDPVKVYDLEANLGKELWIKSMTAKDAVTLELSGLDATFQNSETIIIKVNGVNAESQ